jgi:hypothetical protein
MVNVYFHIQQYFSKHVIDADKPLKKNGESPTAQLNTTGNVFDFDWQQQQPLLKHLGWYSGVNRM